MTRIYEVTTEDPKDGDLSQRMHIAARNFAEVVKKAEARLKKEWAEADAQWFENERIRTISILAQGD